MNYPISNRAASLKPSATLALNAKAKQRAAEGHDVINLSVGEPDFDTPEHVKTAAIEAINGGQNKYTAADGTPALKQAIIDKLARDNGLKYEPNQIIASTGAKQDIFNLCLSVINPGDEVIIGAPYWVSYPDIVTFAEGKPVIVKTERENNFCLTAEQIEAAITPKTRMLILNSPSNPTGTTYSKAALQSIAEVLLKHPDILIMSDDIYELIWWSDEPFCNIAMVCPELYDRTIVINGVSKAYAMTGWRLGYAAGPAPIIGAMKKIQSQSTSNPCAITQAATVAALNGDHACVDTMRTAFKERYQLMVEKFSQIAGFELIPCTGAFYIFPCVQKLIDSMENIEDDAALSLYFLEEADIAMTPGSAFGMPGYLRISYAASTESLLKAIDRIQHLLAKSEIL